MPTYIRELISFVNFIIIVVGLFFANNFNISLRISNIYIYIYIYVYIRM